MARRRSAKDDATTRAEAILAGRIAVDVAQLMGSIHGVNPTGRGLPAAEQRRRYALKNRLQGLLVERFADDLAVAPDPTDPRVVTLARRQFPDDLTHAVIDDLDDGARSWVRFQLDAALGAGEQGGKGVQGVPGEDAPAAQSTAAGLQGPPSSPTPDRLDGDPRALLAAGRAALEEYDYEVAREAFERAVAIEPSPDAARALLELLIDHLGDDATALALHAGLPAAIAADPGFQALLATASARAGDAPQAARLLAGIDPGEAIEAWLELGRAALRREDAALLARCLDAIRKAEPAHPLLVTLEEGLAALHDRERPDLVAAARAALDGGDLEQVEAIIADVLGRWPGEPEAVALREEVQARRTAARVQEIRAQADEATRRGEHRAAARAWQRLLDLGGRDAEATSRLGEALRAAQETEERASTDRVIDLLGDPGRLAQGLEAYLDLPAARRREVRERRELPHLAWLETMGAADGPVARRAEAAQAVIAMADAMEAHETGQADEVLRLLRPHASWTRRVGDVSEIERSAREQVDRRAAGRFEEAITEAERVLSAGDLAAARAALARAEKSVLGPFSRQRIRQLERQLAGLAERAELADRYRAAFESGDVGTANAALHRLLEIVDGEERDRWSGEQDRLAERSRELWTVGELDGPAESPPWWRAELSEVRAICRLLDRAGEILLLARLRGEHLFLTAIDLETGGVVHRRVMHMRSSAGALASVGVDDRTVWLLGTQLATMGIERGTGDVCQWASLNSWIVKSERIQHSTIVPEVSRLWLTVYRPETPLETRTRVIDLRRWAQVREIANRGTPICLPGDVRNRVAVIAEGGYAITLFDADGQPADRAAWTLPASAVTATAGARLGGGDRIVALVRTPRPVGPPALSALSCEDDGTLSRPVELPGLDADAHPSIVPSQSTGLLFVEGGYRGGDRRIVALADHPTGLRELWRARTPIRVALAHDAGGQNVVALWFDRGRYRFRRLGASPPEFPGELEPGALFPAAMKAVAGCALAEGELLAGARRLREELTDLEPKVLFRELQRRRTMDDPDELFRLALTYHDGGLTEESRLIGGEGALAHPHHAGLAVLTADAAAARRDWSEVRGRLEPHAETEPDPSYARHLFHLLGVARAWTGDPEGAAEAFERAAVHPGSCAIDGWQRLVGPGQVEHDAGAPIGIQALSGAIREADDGLERGDLDGAIRSVDRHEVWCSLEVQSFARLVGALLRRGPRDEEQWFAITLAAATFVELFETRDHVESRLDLGGELPYPGRVLDDGTLEDLAHRCAEWLESAKERLAELRAAGSVEGEDGRE